MNGEHIKHAVNHAEEEPKVEAGNATTLLLLMEGKAVQVHQQSPDLVTSQSALVSIWH